MKKLQETVKEFFNAKANAKNRVMLVILASAVTAFVVLAGISYANYRTQSTTLARINASQQVLKRGEVLLDRLLYTRSQVKDYTVNGTGDDNVYRLVTNDLDSIDQFVADDAYQKGRVGTMMQLASDCSTQLREIMASDSRTNASKNSKTVRFFRADAQCRKKLKTAISELREMEWLKTNNYRKDLAKQQFNSFLLNLIAIAVALLFGFASLFVFFRDREERTKVENNLTELNLNKDKFFSIISHDLRGPTANIVRLSEFLMEPNLTEEDNRTMLSHLHKSAQNLQKLLENLLNWAKFQMGRLDYTPTPVELSALINESISQVGSIAAEKAIMIKNKVSIRTYAYADDQMILMVMRNLLVNALKFTNPSGQVQITATEKPHEVEISVTDTGIGMSQDTVGKLFRIGNHFTTLGTANEKGSGLGLILCMELLEKNNGSIRVSSEKDKGTTFTFTLPKLNGQEKS